MMLKENYKPRKKKAELMEAHRQKEEENRHIGYLMEAETAYASRNCKLEDGLTAIEQNQKMSQYLKEKGLMGSDGKMND